MLKGITFSDLHLLAGRQKEKHWEPWMRRWRSDYDLCILNGDIFDFRWSRERDRIQSIRIAEAWLRHLLEPRERAHFVILLGNHDSCPHYQLLLKQLSDDYEHLHWEEHWWVLGDKIFLHGDIPDLSGELETLQAYRAHHNGLSMQPPHPIRHWFYKSATRVGITGTVPRVLPWRKQCLRTDIFLQNQLGSRYDAIRDVYLGHTHVHFADYEHHGTLFHNCGAPFRGARFRPAEFQFSDTQWQASRQNPLGVELYRY
ncbi:MAG: hypothetical protein ABQ298_03380 [Puniceicoccaceae bacterium]